MKTDYREASICSVVSQLVQRKGPFEITVLSKASEAVCGSAVDKSKATDNVFLFFGTVSLARIPYICQQLVSLPHRNTNQIFDI